MISLISDLLTDGEEVRNVISSPAEPPSKEDDYFVLTNKRIFQFVIHRVMQKRSNLRVFYLKSFSGIHYSCKSSGESKISLCCPNGDVGFEMKSKEDLQELFKSVNGVMIDLNA